MCSRFHPGPSFVNGFAGDIAISADIAKQNARRLGHSAAQEIKILALHGVLHLVGYDHEHDARGDGQEGNCFTAVPELAGGFD